MTETAVDRAVRNNRDAFGIDHRAPRDLRRSAAGLCEGPGVDRLVIRKILNYTGSDITAVYDRHGYDREKQRALNQWGKELQSIIREARA